MVTKILWFSLSPCGSLRRNGAKKTNQGWMISLEDEIKKIPSIELSVAYFSSRQEDPFEFDGVHYYPIFESDKVSFLNRFLSTVRIDSKRLPLLLEVIRKCNPDLIHIHGTEGSYANVLPYVKNIPIVISIQGLIAPISEKYFAGLTFNQIKRHESLMLTISTLGIKRTYKEFCKKAQRECNYLSHAKYIFGRTMFDKNVCMSINPNIQYRVVNEILRPEFYCHNWLHEHSNNTNKLRLITVSSPNAPYKGYETLLKTAKILKDYSHINFTWDLIGFRDNSKWLIITEKAMKIRHQDVNVRIIGNKTPDEMIDFFMNSDIFVAVSHIENSSNAICEAMLVGMPIIASYAGGTMSLMSHEKDGLLIQDGDPYVLAGTIINLARNPQKALQYADAARKRALSRHAKKNIIKQLTDGYNAIIKDFKVCMH